MDGRRGVEHSNVVREEDGVEWWREEGEVVWGAAGGGRGGGAARGVSGGSLCSIT